MRTLLFFILILPSISIYPDTSRSFDFEYREGMAPFDSVEELLEKPTKMESIILPLEGPSPKSGSSERRNFIVYSDYHTIYPLPMKNFISVLLDRAQEDQIYPRIIKSEDLSPEKGPWEPHFQEVITSFRFLGIGQHFHYKLLRVPEMQDDVTFLIKWTLADSYDGKFFLLYGSWYLKEFFYRGNRYTYLRNFVKSGFSSPPLGAAAMINFFSERESRIFFDSLYQAAKNQN